MNRIFVYLDKAIKEVYKEDMDIINDQSLNSVVFRVGLNLNSLLKRDIVYKDYYVDFNFKDKDIEYLDLVIHNRVTHQDLIAIKLTKDPNEIKNDIYTIKLITEDLNDLAKHGVLIVLHKDCYNCYKLSPNYYKEEDDIIC
ncbi:MAG: hypothetical protein WC006_07700 [Bacilli bacterium]